jgi:hypothetical protein
VKRRIEVRFVKDTKSDSTESTDDVTLEGKAAIISHHIEKAFGKVGKAVVGYVVADTLRQVIVAQAAKK